METFAAPDLSQLLTRVQTDIDDTRFVLDNTQSQLPDLYKGLDVSERARQTALTDSEDETDELSAESTSEMLRGTIRQREKEASDLQEHLDAAKEYQRLVRDMDSKRKRGPHSDEYRESAKRVVTHKYRPASYDFN